MGVALGQEATYHPDPRWQAPVEAAQRSNPLAGNPQLAGGGRKLLRRHCAECHGKDASGSERAPALTLPLVQSQTDGALFWKITNGNAAAGMPSWSRLPETQRWQLILFLRTLPGR